LKEDGEYTAVALLRGLTKKGEEVEASSTPLRISFSRQSKEEPTPEPVVVEPKEEKSEIKPIIPVVPLGIVVGLGALVAFALISRTKKQVQKSGPTVQKYVPHKQLIDAISALEEKVSTSSVEINDPIFGLLDKQREDGVERVSSSDAQVAQPENTQEVPAETPKEEKSTSEEPSTVDALPDDI
jgi:hypothetical protein